MFGIIVLHITDSTDQGNIFVVKWWHYIRDERNISRCIQVICWTQHSHLVGVWNEINKRLVCLSRRWTHAEMSHRLLHGWKLAGHKSGSLGLKSRLGRDTNKSHFLVLQVILSCISIQVFQFELWQHFWTGDKVVGFQSQVKVARFVSRCSSGAACARPFCMVVGWCGSVIYA